MSSIRQDKTGYVINKIKNPVNLVNPVKKKKSIGVNLCLSVAKCFFIGL
jgi:hypothetical protein